MQVQEVNNPIISVKNLTKLYEISQSRNNILQYFIPRRSQKIVAVNEISFNINKGDCVGFIGPNGSGKSTTIKMLTGILSPTSGDILVLGRNPNKDRKKNAKQIGVVLGQKSQLWWDLPVIDSYKLLKSIYKIPNNIYIENLNYYCKSLGINDYINQPVRQLSLGQRMRAELCAALLHNPDILFLDEPTIGLDIIVKKQLRNIIKNVNEARKVTVVLTTHDLSDIDVICDRIISINCGKIVLDEQLSIIKQQFQKYTMIDFTCSDFCDDSLCSNSIVKYTVNQNVISVIFDNSRITKAQIIEEIMKKFTVIDIKIKSPSIEDLLIKYYQPKTITKSVF